MKFCLSGLYGSFFFLFIYLFVCVWMMGCLVIGLYEMIYECAC